MLINIDGTDINYICEGEGESILIMHGWGANIPAMMPVHNILKNNFKVYTIDFPGFGESPEPKEAWGVFEYADFIKKFIDIMEIKKITLIGHSFGGRISLILSSKYPDLVNRMVLIDGAGLIPKRTFKYYFKVYSFKTLKKIYNLLFFFKDKEERMKKFYTKFGSQDYKDANPIMKKVLVKVVNEDLRPLLKDIKANTLLIWGRNDTATPVYMAEIMEKEIENSGLVILENAGHFSYIDQYAQFSAVIRSFFKID